MFGRGRKPAVPAYDTSGKIPVIRASICTKERVAGFKDEKTGKFDELALLRSEADLRAFLRQYGLTEEQVKREW